MRTEDVRLSTILFRGVSGQPHGEASLWVPTSSRRDPSPGHSSLTLGLLAGNARSRHPVPTVGPPHPDSRSISRKHRELVPSQGYRETGVSQETAAAGKISSRGFRVWG